MMSVESWSAVGVLWSCDQKKCFAFPAVSDEAVIAPTVANAATARTMPRISLRIVPSSRSSLPEKQRSRRRPGYAPPDRGGPREMHGGRAVSRILIVITLLCAPAALAGSAADPGVGSSSILVGGTAPL